jgi:hypothetical protein
VCTQRACSQRAYSVHRAWRGIVCRDGWKYCCFEGVPWLLFALKEDEYEQANLVHNSAFAQDRLRCHTRLQALLEGPVTVL